MLWLVLLMLFGVFVPFASCETLVCPFEFEAGSTTTRQSVLSRSEIVDALRTEMGLPANATPWDAEAEVGGLTQYAPNEMMHHIRKSLISTDLWDDILALGCQEVLWFLRRRVARTPLVDGGTLTFDRYDTERDIVHPRIHSLPRNPWRGSALPPSSLWRVVGGWIFEQLTPHLAWAALGPAPTTAIFDNCNRSVGPPLNDNGWVGTEMDGGSQGYSANGTVCTGSGVGEGGGIYRNADTAADQEWYAEWITVPTVTARIYVRAQSTGTTGWDGYLCRYVHSSNNLRIAHVTNNVETLIGTGVTFTFDPNDRWMCRIVGNTISSHTSDDGGAWVQQQSATESTITGPGRGGMAFNATTQFDNIGGGAVVLTSGRRRAPLVFE